MPFGGGTGFKAFFTFARHEVENASLGKPERMLCSIPAFGVVATHEKGTHPVCNIRAIHELDEPPCCPAANGRRRGARFLATGSPRPARSRWGAYCSRRSRYSSPSGGIVTVMTSPP